jgi:mRNA-degrading endonuclease RelE of RelBE toxin-antitoxin system
MLMTIVELPEYLRKSGKLLNEAEQKEIVDYLADHPKAGDLLRDTGGIRKLRWSRGSRGKSGGVRIIYYFHDERMPLYLLTVFGKGEQANLDKAERNDLAKLVKILVTSALEGKVAKGFNK